MADDKTENVSNSPRNNHRREMIQPPPFIAATFPPSKRVHNIIKDNLWTVTSSASGTVPGDLNNDKERRRAAKRRAKEIIKEIGGFGCFQIYVYFLTLYPNLMAGMVIIQTAFVLATPRHRCFIPTCEDYNATYDGVSTGMASVLSQAIPIDDVTGEWEGCEMYQVAGDQLAPNSQSGSCLGSINESKITCPNNWYVYDFDALARTAVTEWNLVCADSKYASIAATVFMSGNLVASISSGWLADKYGRRSVYYWTPTLATIASLVAAHSTNIWVYTVAGFFQSFTLYSLIGTTFTLGVESVGKDWTTVAGNGYPIAFVVGELALAGTFYLSRDWRVALMIMTLGNLSMTLLPFLSPESVKWLLAHQREYEAVETLEIAAKMNRIKLKESPPDLEDENEDGVTENVGILDMLKNPILLRWILGDTFSGFVINLNYYALSLGVSTLTGSMGFYTSFTVMAIIEVPFVSSVLIGMRHWGLRSLLISSLLLTGFSCLLSLPSPPEYSLWLGVLGKGFASAASTLKWIYTAELYPTSTRSVGVGVMATAGSIGCLVAPSVASAGFYQNKGLLIICGALSILAGITSFDLPETKGRELPETIDDVVKLKGDK